MREKREFFRIKDRLEIEYREIDKEEFLQLERQIKYRPSQTFSTSAHERQYEDGRKWEDDKEMVVTYLKAIDRKISAILDMLSRSSHNQVGGQAKIFNAWYGEVDISGAGLSLVLQTPVIEGTLLHVKVMLPVFPYPAIHVLCEAVRRREVPTADSTCWRNGFKFLVINDLDRDLLISYIFVREREQIRLHKALENG